MTLPAISESHKNAVKDYLTSLNKEFDDIPPWMKKKSVVLAEIAKAFGSNGDDSISDELNVLDSEQLIELKKAVQLWPEDEPENDSDDEPNNDNNQDDNKPIIPELKKSPKIQDCFKFNVLNKSPSNQADEYALNLPSVKKFLKEYGDFDKNEIVIVHGHGSSAKQDRDRHEVDPSAFIKSIDVYREKFNGVVLRQHDLKAPVGHILHHEVDEITGKPYVVVYFDDPTMVKEVRQGKFNAFSYWADSVYEYVDHIKNTRRITELDMYEFSAVTIPANTDATFSILKSIKTPRITGIEDITPEQEEELSKSVWEHIKDRLGIKPKDSPELKVYKSVENAISEWLAEIDNENKPLIKAGAKMARTRLTKLRTAIDTLLEVMSELIDEVNAEENKNSIKKTVKNTEVEKMSFELADIERLLDKKLDDKLSPVYEKLNVVSSRQDTLEKATGVDPETTLKKSISEEISSNISKTLDEKFDHQKEGFGKIVKTIDSLDERLKKIELVKSPSRIAKGNGNEDDKPKEYAEMTAEEKDKYWENWI